MTTEKESAAPAAANDYSLFTSLERLLQEKAKEAA